ncbi:MAG: transglutaminase domain-containing protein [Nitrososphaeria archaeon]
MFKIKAVGKTLAIALTTIIVVLISSFTGTILYYNSLINEKNTQIKSLSTQKIQLQVWLENNITQLNSITREKEMLESWLKENKTYYEQTIASLQNQITILNNKILELDSEIKVYQKYKEEYSVYTREYENLKNVVNQRFDQSNVKAFITPEDKIVSDTVYKITGGWSNPSDWNEFWKDVRTMYNWVLNNIRYRNDGLYPMLPPDPSGKIEFENEMWQFANETLNLREGDCEDMAILLCSMIRCYVNSKYPAEVIIVYGESSGHAAVQIPVSGYRLVILDPAGKYYTQDILGNVAPNDIKTEINKWLNYWKTKIEGNIQVNRIFSDTIDKEFNSTNEYITWMYSR